MLHSLHPSASGTHPVSHTHTTNSNKYSHIHNKLQYLLFCNFCPIRCQLEFSESHLSQSDFSTR